jgi:hypothetical protein
MAALDSLATIAVIFAAFAREQFEVIPADILYLDGRALTTKDTKVHEGNQGWQRPGKLLRDT